jgi:putative transposase
MADRVVSVDVRAAVVSWPEKAPRGAVTAFCRHHEVSTSWFYEVRKRALSEPALQAMQPRARSGAVRHPQAIAAAVEDLAVQIRKDLADQGLDHGPVTVRWHLQQAGLKAPAASTLARIFSARGMVTAQPQKRPKTSHRRFSFAQAHECWQLDSFEWLLADGTVVAIFQLSDDCTRYAIASHVAPSENAAGAQAVVERGINAFQTPLLLLTDNGAAFNRDRLGKTTQLSAYLRRLGCKPITGRPYHPQTQGKNERVHQTAQRWLRAHPLAHSIAELQVLIETFDATYNHHRPHQALQMRTPAQALREAVLAVAPQPPEPPHARGRASAADAEPKTRVLHRRADENGKVTVNYVRVLLGCEHAHTDVAVLASGHSLSIFTTTGGELIRTVVLEPGKRYYSNGRPRGTRPRSTKVSTLT